MRDLPGAGADQDSDSRQRGLVREALQAAWRAIDPGLERRRLLASLQGFHQARRPAAGVSAPHRIRLPVRLRAVSRSRTAFLPGADRDHRTLQPDLPGLLRRILTGANRLHAAGQNRENARRAGGERGRARSGADIRRRADLASGFLRDPRCGSRPSDPPCHDQHQRASHCPRARFRSAARRKQARPGSLSAVRFTASATR